LGAIIKFCKRSSAGIRESRPTHAIFHRRHLLVIDELHQIALLKVTKHLDVADPSAVVWPAKMGTAIATARAQYRRFGRGNVRLLQHWHSCFRRHQSKTPKLFSGGFFEFRAAKALKAPRRP
jgi:hypothetical protein